MDLKTSFTSFFNFLKDCISLNTSKSIIFVIILIVTILFLVPTDNLSILPTKCVFKNYIIPFIYNYDCPESGLFKDCSCPGCGLTRGLSEFLKGNFNNAVNYNVLVIPVVLILLFLFIKNSVILLYKK